jgi:hypothetical protein
LEQEPGEYSQSSLVDLQRFTPDTSTQTASQEDEEGALMVELEA